MYESQAKDQLVHFKTGNIAPYSRSEDGSITQMKTAREIRPRNPSNYVNGGRNPGDERPGFEGDG